MHYAAREGHKEITDLLLTNGADVNAKNDEGGTPLDWAECCNDKKETVDLLRKYGGKTSEELKAAGKQSSSSSERSCAFHICIAFRN